MNKDSIVFIGLDTHKDFFEVTYCLDDRGSTSEPPGRVIKSKQAITKLDGLFQSKYPPRHFALCLRGSAM